MEPVVSIIIPVYNAEKTLELCLVSCLRQTLTSYEILLIDDGSTDRSLQIADSYLARFPDKLRLFCQENRGPSCARNLGLTHAKGKYIGFVDADDRIDRDMFLRLVHAAESKQADLVVCGRYDVVQNHETEQFIRRIPYANYPCASIYEIPELLCDTTQFVWDKLFLRSVIETLQLRFDERFRYTEDVLFLCTYKSVCKRIAVIPDTLYYHYSDERTPVTKYGSSLLDVPDVLREIYDLYFETLSFPHPDVLFDLAAKRFLFRVKRFPYMGSKLLQWKFCCRMYRIMKQYFPDWRKRIAGYHRGGFHSGFTSLYRGSRILMGLYIALPNAFKQYWLRLSEAFPAKKRRMRQRITAIKKRSDKFTVLFLNAYYRFFLDRKKVNPAFVLIQSKGGRIPTGNMFALLTESLRHNKKIIVPLRTEEQKRWKQFAAAYHLPAGSVRTVKPDSFRYYRLLASCAYLLNDSTFPHRFQKKRGQIYLNTWHGVPLKHMGCDVPSRAYAIGDVQRNFLQADYLLFPNLFMQETMLRSYMLDYLYSGTVLQEAYPRVGLLTNQARGESIRQVLGLSGKKICCYLPTWRGLMTKKENSRQHSDCLRYLTQLDERLPDDTVLYVKLHPYAERGFRISSYRHIRPFPTEYETYDFLTACDVLITDYSSIFFDFAATRKKIILFVYDYEDYKNKRGLYLDPADLPFPLAKNAEELAQEIRLTKTYDDADFLATYCPFDEKSSAAKLCSFLYQKAPVCRTVRFSPAACRLYYASLLTPGATLFYTEYLMQTIPAGSPPAIACIRGSELKNYPERIKKLLLLSPFLSVDVLMFFTPLEALAYVLLIKKHVSVGVLRHCLEYYLQRLFSREYRRKFSDTVFCEIYFCCQDDTRYFALFSSLDTPFLPLLPDERTLQT